MNHTELIARLRDWRGDPDEVMSEAANALEAHAVEIERLKESERDLQAKNGYSEYPVDSHVY